MKDFTEASELLTPDGALKGLNAIRSFFEEIFKIMPKGTALEMKQMIIRDDVAYVVWSAESSFVSIPLVQILSLWKMTRYYIKSWLLILSLNNN